MFMRKRPVSLMKGKSEVVLTKDVPDLGMANETMKNASARLIPTRVVARCGPEPGPNAR